MKSKISDNFAMRLIILNCWTFSNISQSVLCEKNTIIHAWPMAIIYVYTFNSLNVHKTFFLPYEFGGDNLFPMENKYVYSNAITHIDKSKHMSYEARSNNYHYLQQQLNEVI